MEAISRDYAIADGGATLVAPSTFRELLFSRLLGQSLDAYVAKEDRASGIVSLQRERAFAENSLEIFSGLCICRLLPLDDGLSVDLSHNFLPVDLDVNFEPLVILSGCRKIVLHTVDTRGFLGVVVGIVDLAFKSCFWPTFILVLGVEVNA